MKVLVIQRDKIGVLASRPARLGFDRGRHQEKIIADQSVI